MDGCTADFFENNDHSLRSQKIVLRDSLGLLAVQILSASENLSSLGYHDMLVKLYVIIDELHAEYHRCNGHFEA